MKVVSLHEGKVLLQTPALQGLCARLGPRSWGHRAYFLLGEVMSHGDEYWEKERKPGKVLVRDERTRVTEVGGGHSEKVTFELRPEQ